MSLNAAASGRASATANVFCLACSKSFPEAELAAHVTNAHFGFLPFACTSCDFTAASEHEVLQHATQEGHIPYAADHSSSRPYLSLLTKLAVAHCKTFAHTKDFGAILAELNAQISAHGNILQGIKSQADNRFVPISQDSESSSERSASTPQSAQNADHLKQEDSQQPILTPKANETPLVDEAKKLKSPAKASKPTSAKRRMLRSSVGVNQGPGGDTFLGSFVEPEARTDCQACALCASNETFLEHQKQEHVMQHLGRAGPAGGQDASAFFSEAAELWQRCFPSAISVSNGAASQIDGYHSAPQSHVTKRFRRERKSSIERLHEQLSFGDAGLVAEEAKSELPSWLQQSSVELDGSWRRYPVRRTSSIVKAASVDDDKLIQQQLDTSIQPTSTSRRSTQPKVALKSRKPASSPPEEGSGPLFCRVCDHRLTKGAKAPYHVWRYHMDGCEQFSCGVCGAKHNVCSYLRGGCAQRHPGVEPIIETPSGELRDKYVERYRECFAKTPYATEGYLGPKTPAGSKTAKVVVARQAGRSKNGAQTATKKSSGGGFLSNKNHVTTSTNRLKVGRSKGAARARECRLCSTKVPAQNRILKRHALHKHFTGPRKIYECSKCGHGANVKRENIVQHVRNVHAGEASVHVIDRTKKLARRIQVCLESCFPEAFPDTGLQMQLEDPGPDLENVPGFNLDPDSAELNLDSDIPGTSGYIPAGTGADFGEFENEPGSLQLGLDEEENEGEEREFVSVVIKQEHLPEPVVAIGVEDVAAASNRSLYRLPHIIL